MPPRVAIVSREYPPFFGGGIGTYARSVVPALARAGCAVHVVTQAYDGTNARVETSGRVTVHRIPVMGGGAGWSAATARFAVEAGRLVADLAAQKQIDIAEFPECEAPGFGWIAARCVRRGLGVPAVVVLHTPSEVLYALRSLPGVRLTPEFVAGVLSERAAILGADHVAAPSRFIAEWAKRYYGLGEMPEVIPYPYALPPACPERPVQKRVLFVGRLETRKGVEPLIRAWNEIAPRFPGWTLRLAGADTSSAADQTSMKAWLLSLVHPGVVGSVCCVGSLRPELLTAEYAAASLCVVPSLWENFPNTCIEAMAQARAVAVSDEGGMAEMVGASNAGVIFRAGDVGDLGRALTVLMSESPARRGERGVAGRDRIGVMCDPGTTSAARIAMYERVIARAASLSPAIERRRALRLWRELRGVAMGHADRLGLPRFEQPISDWLEPGVAA